LLLLYLFKPDILPFQGPISFKVSHTGIPTLVQLLESRRIGRPLHNSSVIHIESYEDLRLLRLYTSLLDFQSQSALSPLIRAIYGFFNWQNQVLLAFDSDEILDSSSSSIQSPFAARMGT